MYMKLYKRQEMHKLLGLLSA